MATTEERVDKLEVRFATLEQQVAAVVAKVEMLVTESQQQREDIRRAQEKHDADIKEMNAKIDSKFDKLGSQIQSLTIAAVVGVGAIVIGGGAIIWAAITSLK